MNIKRKIKTSLNRIGKIYSKAILTLLYFTLFLIPSIIIKFFKKEIIEDSGYFKKKKSNEETLEWGRKQW